MAMDAGPYFSFANGHSLFVSCETQEEIDRISAKLIAGGGEQQPCGWLKDRFGISWQIIPSALGDMMMDPEGGNTAGVWEALMKMTEIDIKTLRQAYEKK
jgi:predicted 3-demethylubiquinone-9 3-methyltransferase (glyoxalase superfamily)